MASSRGPLRDSAARRTAAETVWRGSRVLAPAACFALIGIAVSLVGPTDVLVLMPILMLASSIVAVRFGTRAVVMGSMLSVGLTASMNGVRAGGDLALADVFLVIAALGLLVSYRAQRFDRPTLPGGFAAGVALLIAGGCLGTLFADSPTVSVLNLVRFSLAAILPVLVVRAWGPDPRTIRLYTWFWVCGAVISGMVGLLSAGDVSGRSAGLATHPNHLAMISAMSAGLALMLAMTESEGRRWVAAGMFGILAFTVVGAGSRAGLLALVVTSTIVFLRTRERRTRVAAARRLTLVWTFVVVAAVVLAVGVVEVGQHNAVERLLGDSTSDSSDEGRAQLLEAGIHGIDDHPLTGSGLETALRAHNIYVQVWTSAGLVGLAGIIVIALTAVRSGFRRQPTRAEAYLAAAYVAGYVGYLAAGAVQNFLWDRYLWLNVAMVLWLGTLATASAAETDLAQQCE